MASRERRGGRAVPLIDAVWARRVAAELDRRGVAPGPVLAAAGLDADAIDGREARIAFRRHAALFEAASAASGDRLFGLALGTRADMRDVGLVAYVCLNARTVGEAVRNLERYIAVFNEAAIVRHAASPGRFEVELGFADRGAHAQAVEFSVTLFVGAVRALAGGGVAPLEVAFAHPRRAGAAAFARALGCKVAFGQGRTALRFDPALARRPLPTADDRLLAVLVGYCRDILARRGGGAVDLRRQVEQEILARLQAGEARVERVAAALGMSARTLARRLGEEGESFASILRGLREDLARRYLADRQLALGEVAFLVGYGDASAFAHAFKRWTGTQPGAHRRAA